ncbi:MAG: 2-C-methyl-D-erythritol 2,4-cyclodiphosphate synthase [Acidobacteria bacterium]|nr:2-C-methyl-D-erythritol 2,4-cyclodiphosphate synthase [Acidobacteriota bacterium]
MGIDVHRFAPDRELWLGCVRIPHPLGLEGHSDADALVHALVDAILGALGRRDIGYFYPPGEAAWKGCPGHKFLEDMRDLLRTEGWAVENIDAVVLTEAPRLSPHIPGMIGRVAGCLGIEEGRVGIKAGTTEGLGFPGRREGVWAQAVVLLRRAGGHPPTEERNGTDE